MGQSNSTEAGIEEEIEEYRQAREEFEHSWLGKGVELLGMIPVVGEIIDAGKSLNAELHHDHETARKDAAMIAVDGALDLVPFGKVAGKVAKGVKGAVVKKGVQAGAKKLDDAAEAGVKKLNDVAAADARRLAEAEAKRAAEAEGKTVQEWAAARIAAKKQEARLAQEALERSQQAARDAKANVKFAKEAEESAARDIAYAAKKAEKDAVKLAATKKPSLASKVASKVKQSLPSRKAVLETGVDAAVDTLISNYVSDKLGYEGPKQVSTPSAHTPASAADALAENDLADGNYDDDVLAARRRDEVLIVIGVSLILLPIGYYIFFKD